MEDASSPAQRYGHQKVATGIRVSWALRTKPHLRLDLRVTSDGLDRQQRTGQALRSPGSGVPERKTRSTASHAATRPVPPPWLEEGGRRRADQPTVVVRQTRSDRGPGWTLATRRDNLWPLSQPSVLSLRPRSREDESESWRESRPMTPRKQLGKF